MKIKNLLQLSLLFTLYACQSSQNLIEGQRKPLFENNFHSKTDTTTKIILEKPIINNSWNTNNYTSNNNSGHLAGKKYYKKLLSTNIGYNNNKTNLILYKPVANENKVFAIDGNLKITAIDLKTGKINWINTDLKDSNSYLSFGSLLLNNNYLYAINNTGKLIKIEEKTGKTIYTTNLNTNIKSSLQNCNNYLLTSNDNNELFIIDKNTGSQITSYKTIEENSSFIKGSSSTCNKYLLIHHFSGGDLHALDLTTLKPIWSKSITHSNNINDTVASPIIYKNYLLSKNYNSLQLSDLKTGNNIWKILEGGTTTPIISNEIIFNINNKKTVNAINLKTGKIIWNTPILNKDGILFDPLLINNQLFIPASNGEITILDPYSGNIKNKLKIKNKLDVSPIIVNGKLITISNANLIVLN